MEATKQEASRRDDERGSLGIGIVRCPYCHGDLDPEASDWVACRRCLARHHTGCWSEHRACASCGSTRRLALEGGLASWQNRRSRLGRAFAAEESGVRRGLLLALPLIFFAALFAAGAWAASEWGASWLDAVLLVLGVGGFRAYGFYLNHRLVVAARDHERFIQEIRDRVREHTRHAARACGKLSPP